MDGPTTCPRCFATFDRGVSCPVCQLAFERRGGLIDVLAGTERAEAAALVERFYTKSPFPGYAPADDAGTLLDRSRRAPFLVALDAALPADATVLDCGCGTAQLAAFLAIAAPRRRVFGIDGCRASLECAEEFRARVGLANLQLVRADLFDLPVRPGSFGTVICRGVVHHTPDPAEAIRRVARCVAPGGVLVLGFYETWARAFHRLRRGLARFHGGEPLAVLDPLLRRKELDPEKRRIWIDDQYRHPLERILPLPWTLRILEDQGFTWVRTVPPAAAGADLFRATVKPAALGSCAVRGSWALRGLTDPDAGLVCLIARRS